MHAHTSWYTHAHHNHTHTTHMYANVYTRIHCGRKAILQNFVLIE